MKERPILFNSQMVQAIFEGRKTQTRRVAKCFGDLDKPIMFDDGSWNAIGTQCGMMTQVACPYGKVGDRLWVRETFHLAGFGMVDYKADNINIRPAKWKPSIFMPKWASRITLEITNIRVERLNDISENDAKAEGIECWMDFGDEVYKDYLGRHHALNTPQFAFKSLWESINGFDSWQNNPWVWVVEFKRIENDRHN